MSPKGIQKYPKILGFSETFAQKHDSRHGNTMCDSFSQWCFAALWRNSGGLTATLHHYSGAINNIDFVTVVKAFSRAS
jgi:hypothetical protein